MFDYYSAQTEYTIDVKGRFNALQAQIEDHNDADTMFNNKEASEKNFPKKEKKKHYLITLKEETFAISRFLAQFAKVYSREIFVIYISRKFILAKKEEL